MPSVCRTCGDHVVFEHAAVAMGLVNSINQRRGSHFVPADHEVRRIDQVTVLKLGKPRDKAHGADQLLA